MSQSNFDSRAPTWDQEPRRQRLATDIAAGIQALVPLTRGMQLLDYGCGTGLVAMHLLPHVGHITGLDSSPGMLSVFAGKLTVEDRQRVSLETLDLAAGGLVAGTFDVVIAAMLLHHVDDPPELIKRFCHHLNPGGYLCLADLDSEDGTFHDDPTGVCHHGFDREQLAAWLLEAGLMPQSAVTVSTIEKGSAAGPGRMYPVFLVSALRL